MLSWREVLAYQDRYDDLLRDAEKDAVLMRDLALAEKRDSFHCRLLTWVGRRLVSWGASLQERYGTVVEAPSIQPLHRTQYGDEWRYLQEWYGAPAETATLQAAHRTQYVAQPECRAVGRALAKEEGRYCSSRSH